MQPTTLTTSSIAAAVLALLLGCDSGGVRGTKTPAAPATQKSSTPLENRTPDDAYGRPASVSQPAGSKADPARRTVPPEASLMAGGAGELNFIAEADGVLFVVFADSGRLVYRGHVSRGQNVKLDPDARVLQIGNKTVVRRMSGGSKQQYKLFLQRT
jgi:hypothetical protein